MKVLYYSFSDFNSATSGSSMRPYKINNAFKKLGYEVILINGDINKRWELFRNFKKEDAFDNIDYCYIEPSTYPCHPLDYIMFAAIKMMKIPTGIFYRDMYYKFPELFKKRGIKKLQLLSRYKLDWFFYKKIAKTIFFPSSTMAKHFKFKNKKTLPPAGEIIKMNSKVIKYNLIYVGGVSNRYGTDILLEAVDIVNKEYGNINLHLICRKYEEHFFDDYRDESWLKIIHASGEKLSEYYNNSDIALIPLRINEYNNFAVPVKLFEYLSYNMPIVTTNCFETARFVKENEVGLVTDDNSRSLADAIINLYKNKNLLEFYSKQARKKLYEENLWEHRVLKIEKNLLG